MGASEKKHFCVLPWISVSINQDGRVNACARANFESDHAYGFLHQQSLEQIWNARPIKDMRKKLLQDQPVFQCRNCYDVEKAGAESFRQVVNRSYVDLIPEIISSQASVDRDLNTIRFLEVRFSNLCNLKCRTCEPYNSTSWYREADLGNHGKAPQKVLRPTEKIEELQELLLKQIPYLTELSFLGGEPLMDDTHYWLLEKLIELKKTDVHIKYNTNFSNLQHKKWNVLKLWAQLENVHVSMSLDGIDERFNILRKGNNWEQVVKNHRILRVFAPRVFAAIYTCISVMNCFHVTTAIEKWIELGILNHPKGISFNILEGPTCFSINILNENERQKLREHYRLWLSQMKAKLNPELYTTLEREFNVVLNSFNKGFSKKDRQEFLKITSRLDQSRNEDFFNFFPELTSIKTEQ